MALAKYQTYKYDKNGKTYYRCVAIVGRLDNGKPNRIESSAVTKKRLLKQKWKKT